MVEKHRSIYRNPLFKAAIERGKVMMAKILQMEGGCLEESQVAQVLSTSHRKVREGRRLGAILALTTNTRRYVYPSWQFGSEGLLDGITEALLSMDVSSPWMQAAFFLGENVILDGKRPIDEIRNGNLEAVYRVASAVGKQGGS